MKVSSKSCTPTICIPINSDPKCTNKEQLRRQKKQQFQTIAYTFILVQREKHSILQQRQGKYDVMLSLKSRTTKWLHALKLNEWKYQSLHFAFALHSSRFILTMRFIKFYYGFIVTLLWIRPLFQSHPNKRIHVCTILLALKISANVRA